MHIQDLQLCLLTHRQQHTFQQYQAFLDQAIQGGITAIQLRDKSGSKTDRYRFAQQLRDYLALHHLPLIVNDDIELAKTIEADGVHLGQSDGSPLEARATLGEQIWIGLSIESMTELTLANQLNCLNYVAASALFPSRTKKDCKTYWGLAGLKQVVDMSKYPVIAIGGIDLSHVQAIMQQGAAGIALISAIHNATDPKSTTEVFRHLIGREQS